ncbi:MAG: DUF531 family protein [Methanomassiliicoccaceae archaeon]|jgi:hypothetical protein|nr:DUF531 family protein [Euryarchaeota archaeon]HOB38104.1 DUF531 family protein [Methanomassiliicoccaceae archaeon]HQA21206.1 DUF531 family protein [Methanomassiliicoccaceae archaeon]HQD87918.1 DUF531 family protein [Methanomassiliicoccaceae archaeon]
MSRLGRATIALYNSYDPTKFREAHRRALARAGPLALAFDLNLATFGFPFPAELQTPREIADWVATTTSIGEHGGFLQKLTGKGRFQTFPYPNRGFPPQLGEAILTTSKPAADRKVGMDDVVAALRSGRSVLVVFGLGPRGAPREVFEMCRMHLDITPGGFSLETCTAMGAVAGVIAHRLRERGH